MSLTDLELLDLVEKAKQKQKGDRGPAGVGIEEIAQHEENSFVIKLTTGEHKKITLPAAKDGAVGPQGVQGERGEPGSPGRPGRDGAPGADALPGVPGRDGDHVDTGVVNSQGELLLGLTSGKVINVGKVVGPAGQTGQRGPTGLPGEAGKDGTAVLGGARSPNADDGKPGDFWIDISTAEFAFFRKADDSNWTKLANLRQPARDTRVSTAVGGSGSGGGSAATWTRDVKLTHPTRGARDLPAPGSLKTQEDANQYFINAVEHAMVTVAEEPPEKPVVGELWWSTAGDELTLYIRIDDTWVPAAPPVSLDGIQSDVAGIQNELMSVRTDIALNKKDIDDAVYEFQPYKDKVDLLERELDKLEGVYIDVVLDYKFGFAPQRPPQPGCGYLRVGDDASSQKPTYKQAQWLNVSPVDLQGNPIDWMSVNKGDVIVVENLDGTGFGAYVNEGPIEAADDWIKFQMVLDESVENNGVGKPVEYEKIRIKVMDSIGLSNYVRKSGDTITGSLQINKNLTVSNKSVFNEKVQINLDPEDGSSSSFSVYGKVDNTDESLLLRATFNDKYSHNNDRVEYYGVSDIDESLVNKKYVDSKARTSEIELSQLAEDETDPDLLQRISAYENPTQEDLNNEIGWSLFNQRRKGGRTSVNLDIVQNTKVDGQWTFVEPAVPESELPQIGDFFLLDADGQWTQEWSEAKTIRINGGDGRAADLSTVRRGTQWLIQDVALNTFAHYITRSVEFIGSVEGGQFVVEAEIEAIYGRAFGGPVVDTVCEVKAFSPHPCITTNDGSKPVVDDDGYLWYDEQTKKLYVSDWNDDQNSNGEAEWIEVGGSGEASDLSDYLKTSGGQMTGDLAFKATGKDEYWSYIRALRPSSWSTTENTHGLILDIGDTNSYKQQFKITGRSGRELFKLNDDGSASATLRGRLNVTEKLSVNGDKVLTQSSLPEDLSWKWVPDPTNTVQERHIYWLEKQSGDLQFNISTVAQNGVIDIPDFESVNVSHPFSIYTKDADGIKMIASGTLKAFSVNTTSSSAMQYLDARVAKTDMTLWRPSYITKDTIVVCKIGGFLP